MKGITIKRVEMSNAGPVKNFSHDFAPLTLVYGPNESGKTTVLENLVDSLFAAKKGRAQNATGRGGVFAGHTRIILQTPDGEKVLQPGEKGIAALLPEAFSGLPADFHRLLYVRAGDPQLEPSGAGISRTLVKGLVSNQQVYEKISASLPKEAGYIEIEQGILHGNQQGNMKRLAEARGKYNAINEASHEFHESLSRVELSRLRQEEVRLREERDVLDRARRHTAWVLAGKMEQAREERDRIDQKLLEKLGRKLAEHEMHAHSLAGAAKRLRQYAPANENLNWLHSARTRYLEFSAERASVSLRWIVPTVMGLAAAAGAAFLINALLGSLLSGISLVLLAVRFLQDRRAEQNPATGNERALEELRREFRKRFGNLPSCIADFDAQEEPLREAVGQYKAAEREQSTNEAALADCQRILEEGLTTLLDGKTPVKDYEKALKGLKDNWVKLDQIFRKLETELARLDVSAAEYLESGPAEAFSGAALDRVEAALAKVTEKIRQIEDDFRSRQSRIEGLLGKQLSTDPGEVSGALEEARAAAEQQIRELMAHLYAVRLVKGVLESFVAEEDRLVESWLADARIGQYVKALTDRYDQLSFQEEELYVGNGKKKFPLSSLSSGAVEQVLLAVRMGIAPALTGQQTLFLLLDDAFQFSDWNRRAMLVDSVERMVTSGWQVVYFTMDDDIRGRINGLGKKLGKKGYTELVLG